MLSRGNCREAEGLIAMSGQEQDHVREARRRNALLAAAKVLRQTVPFWTIAIALFWFNGYNAKTSAIISTTLFALWVAISFWMEYRWLNHKSGIGPWANDPEVGPGP
jgi:hypothetical protein